MKEETYLGDSVYARSDGFHIWLYTDNGEGPNTPAEGIALAPETLDMLIRYEKRLRDKAKKS